MSSRFTYFWKQSTPSHSSHADFDPLYDKGSPIPSPFEKHPLPNEKKPHDLSHLKKEKRLHHFEEIAG